MPPVHDLVKSAFFGPSYSDADITRALVIGGFAFTAVQFLVTVVIPAPYGRYAKRAPSYTKWFEVNTTFAWFFQECPSFFVPLLLTWESWHLTNWPQRIVLCAFMSHYFQRSLVFPFLLSSSSRTTPFLPCASAFAFCSFNGFLQAHAIIYATPDEVLKEGELFAPRFLAGLSLFLLGMWANIDSDRRLRELRKKPTEEKGDGVEKEKSGGNYKIPRGGFFEYVSAANYLGEMAEWTGFFFAARNPGALFFAAFTCVFLGTRGVQHHRFYLEKFGESYPKSRRAVIPFLL